MLKKTIGILLAVCMLFSLSACAGSTENKNSESKIDATKAEDAQPETSINQETVEHSGKKLEGKITRSSVFSEGLAIVSLDGNKEKLYCINKEGYIVFEINESIGTSYAISNLKFKNGLVLINNNIYNKSGKHTTPESVGVTRFYDIAFEGGYILTEKVTADYSSSKKELGVMNKDFEWIVEPSEVLYQNLEKQLNKLVSLNRMSYYYNDYICFRDSTESKPQYLNLKTGELSENSNFEIPSFALDSYTDSTFRDYDSNVIIDLSMHANIKLLIGSEYNDGKVPVLFDNVEAGIKYFTFVDEKGEFLFEPKEIKNMSQVGEFVFDGENLLIMDSAIGAYHIQSYNSKGEFLGELKPRESLGNGSYSCNVNDGVIYVEGSINTRGSGYYFTTDFKPLF